MIYQGQPGIGVNSDDYLENGVSSSVTFSKCKFSSIQCAASGAISVLTEMGGGAVEN
jgi:hypothetical protein